MKNKKDKLNANKPQSGEKQETATEPYPKGRSNIEFVLETLLYAVRCGNISDKEKFAKTIIEELGYLGIAMEAITEHCERQAEINFKYKMIAIMFSKDLEPADIAGYTNFPVETVEELAECYFSLKANKTQSDKKQESVKTSYPNNKSKLELVLEALLCLARRGNIPHKEEFAEKMAKATDELDKAVDAITEHCGRHAENRFKLKMIVTMLNKGLKSADIVYYTNFPAETVQGMAECYSPLSD